MDKKEYTQIEDIIHYLDGSATLDDKTRLLHWLEENEQNRKLFKDIRSIWISSMSIYANDTETEAALEIFRARVNAYRQNKNRRLLRYILSSAAFALLAIGITYVAQKQIYRFVNEEYTAMSSMTTPEGSKDSIVLPDNSVVWLNSNSVLTYPENFSSKKRIVQLTGEAYFEVAHDTKRPFIVRTENMEITVLGTTFNVTDYNENNYAETILCEGSVRAKFKTLKKEFTLQPDEKISYSKTDNQIRIEKIDASLNTLWASDKIVFDNENLSEVLRQLEIWYGVKIEYRKKTKKEYRLTLTISKEPEKQAFTIISDIAPVTYKKVGETIVFIDK